MPNYLDRKFRNKVCIGWALGYIRERTTTKKVDSYFPILYMVHQKKILDETPSATYITFSQNCISCMLYMYNCILYIRITIILCLAVY